eukprot:16169826-Heterocapsa_arctica.AAC.1
MDIPTRLKGKSHARKTNELPDNPHVRKMSWELQTGLISTGCVGSGDSEKGEKLGSLRVITSYRRDVDELIRSHVPRGETWENKRTKIRQYLRVNGHHSLQSL